MAYLSTRNGTIVLAWLLPLLLVGCGVTEPEEVDQFGPIPVQEGQVLRCVRPDLNIVFDGAGTARFSYRDSVLFLQGMAVEAPILPIPAYEPQPPTPDEIAELRRDYPSIPRVNEILREQGLDPETGGQCPTDQQWWEAFQQWEAELQELLRRCADWFGRHIGDNPSTACVDSFALVCADTLKASELVDEDSVQVQGLGSFEVHRVITYQVWGFGMVWILSLVQYYAYGEGPLLTGVTEEAAKARHTSIYYYLKDGEPVVVDVSWGLIVKPNMEKSLTLPAFPAWRALIRTEQQTLRSSCSGG